MWDQELGPGQEEEYLAAWSQAENVVMLMRVIDPSDAGTGGWGYFVLKWGFTRSFPGNQDVTLK